MLDRNSQKSSNIEESKEKKVDASKESESIPDNDDVKGPMPPKSDFNAVGVLKNSNARIGKYKFSDLSIIVFDAIRSLCSLLDSAILLL